MAILAAGALEPAAGDELEEGPPAERPRYGLNLRFRIRRRLGWYGPGYLRLKGALAGYRAEFESLRSRARTEGEDDPAWYDQGVGLLRQAEHALEQGEIEQGWYFVHAAERVELTGLEDLEATDALRTRARELLDQARDNPGTGQARTVRTLLAEDDDGAMKADPTGSEVRAAAALMHEHHQSRHLKRQHLQQQFTGLLGIGIVTLVGFLALVYLAGHALTLPVVGGRIDWQAVLHSPFGALSTAETASIGFVAFVPLAGVLGATLFGMRSLRRQAGSSSTPQHLTGCWVAVTRAVIGAIAAVVVFGFLRSGLVTLPEAVTSAPALLTFAFAAGHTEWLAPRAVDAATSVIDRATADEGG